MRCALVTVVQTCALPISHAIKVGPLYTTESVSVLAQIAADYSHVPLVLHLAPLPDESLLEGTDAEDLQLALFELLLPQTDIVVADHKLLEQWQSEGVFSGTDTDTAAEALLQYGAKWVLSTGAPLRQGHGSQIGRASCRERVCQYGWISVVAGSL